MIPQPSRSLRAATKALSITYFDLLFLNKLGILNITRTRREWETEGLRNLTRVKLWGRYCKSRPKLDTNVAYEDYRKVRRLLRVGDKAHPAWVLRRAHEFLQKRATTRGLKTLLGPEQAVSAMAHLSRLFPSIYSFPRPLQRLGTLDELLALFPGTSGERYWRYLMKTKASRAALPMAKQIGRVLNLRDKGIQLLAASELIRICADNKAQSMAANETSRMTRIDEIMKGGSSRDPLWVKDRWEAYALRAELLAADSDAGRRTTALSYDGLLQNAVLLARRVLGRDAATLTDLLPARHPDAESFRVAVLEHFNAEKEKCQERRAMSAKALRKCLHDIRVGVENRFVQLEVHCNAAMEAIRDNREQLHAGSVETIAPKCRTILPDGSTGVSDQHDVFKIMNGRTLLAELTRKHGHKATIRAINSIMKLKDGQTKDERAHKMSRFFIVYERSKGIDGEQAVEPFYVDLFRHGVLERETFQSGKLRDQRRRKVEECHLTMDPRPPEDLLVAPRVARQFGRLVRAIEGEDWVVIPMLQFYHAMAYARIAIRMAIRWGPRMAEILQLRENKECFPDQGTGIHGVSYMQALPKGWKALARFGIDEGTRSAIEAVNKFTIFRWFEKEDGSGQLPDVQFSLADRRRALTPAPYIFNRGDKMLDPAHLALFIHTLLVGINKLNVHDARYVFATLMGDLGLGYDLIGGLLHHRPKSQMPLWYDLERRGRASSSVSAFNRKMDADMVGQVLTA